jgi:protein SCO1/2
MKVFPVAALAAALIACSHRATSLEVLGDVPQFELISQDGQPFHSQMLAGKVWVADFIYTTCPGPCPRMTSEMREVQDAVSKTPAIANNIRLVSFTVDPANDTPPAMWYFLTGPIPVLQTLDRDAFKLGNIDASMQHSTRFVLVDQRGRIRRYYDSSEASAIPNVISDLSALARESS